MTRLAGACRTLRGHLHGHLLLEAMVSGAILLIALSSVLGAVAAGQRDIAAATVDQRAWQLLRQRYELQRAARRSDPDWAVGTRNGTFTAVQDAQPWTWTVTVSQVADSDVAGVGPLAYRLAAVSVTYRGRTIRLETLRW